MGQESREAKCSSKGTRWSSESKKPSSKLFPTAVWHSPDVCAINLNGLKLHPHRHHLTHSEADCDQISIDYPNRLFIFDSLLILCCRSNSWAPLPFFITLQVGMLDWSQLELERVLVWNSLQALHASSVSALNAEWTTSTVFPTVNRCLKRFTVDTTSEVQRDGLFM